MEKSALDGHNAEQGKVLLSSGSDCNGPEPLNHYILPYDKPTTDLACNIHFATKSRSSKKKWSLKVAFVSIAGVIILLLVVCIILVGISVHTSNYISGMLTHLSGERTTSTHDHNKSVCYSAKCVQIAAQLLNTMDSSVDPCDNFFQYACGTWNKKHIIPDDRSSYNTFEELNDVLQITLKRLLEEPPCSKDTNSTMKAKTLYQSCINTSQIEAVGDSVIHSTLKDLGGWPVASDNWDWIGFDVTHRLAHLRGAYNLPVFIRMMVSTDDKNSSVRIIQIDQTNLGMPSREYYLDETGQLFRESYLKLMVSTAVLLGADQAKAERDMKKVLEFETKIAVILTPQSDRHDTSSMYMKMTVHQLQESVPEIEWLNYLNTLIADEITADEPVVCYAISYLMKMGELVEKETDRVVANYLIWRYLLNILPEMTEKFQINWNEYRRVLEGVQRQGSRWQKCVDFVHGRMGMAVGRMFVLENFDEASKESALEMIHNIRQAFIDILQKSDWMDDETKAVAIEKAIAMQERIGYPDYVLDPEEMDQLYEKLNISSTQYFQNVLNLEAMDSEKSLANLRNPIVKDKWEQDPAVLNAFYNPNTNDIVFPAGILQPMFYSHYSPKSLNYGGIGVVIGHEITHGFDDKGRQYDKDGNMRQWWNDQTVQAFQERAQCMAEQYSQHTLEPFGLKINGRNTQGENIADNGGLKESFKAYQSWVQRNGEEPLLPGIDLSHNQLFFLNYAQIWCGIMRDEEALNKIRTSVHSPGPIRVLVPLSNSVDFAEAFKCPVDSRMNPAHKCHVW